MPVGVCYTPTEFARRNPSLGAYLNFAEIVVSIVLMVLVLLQSKGATFSGTFSSDSPVYRTRRGVEKTMFQFTIVTAVVFVVLAILNVVASA